MYENYSKERIKLSPTLCFCGRHRVPVLYYLDMLTFPRKNHSRANSQGFTLIELLVVITIIGLLASTVLGSLSTAREKARDARRISEAKQLQNALEIYRNKNNGLFPCAANANPGSGTCDLSAGNTAGGLNGGVSALSGSGSKDTTLMNSGALGYTPSNDTVTVAPLRYRVSLSNDRSGYGLLVYQESLAMYCYIGFGNGLNSWATNYSDC